MDECFYDNIFNISNMFCRIQFMLAIGSCLKSVILNCSNISKINFAAIKKLLFKLYIFEIAIYLMQVIKNLIMLCTVLVLTCLVTKEL